MLKGEVTAKKVMLPNADIDIEKTEKIEEIGGKLSMQLVEDKLMHSIIEGDKDKVEEAKLLEDGINNNVGSFTPDMMMQQMVQNYSNAKKLYGETILRLLSSYNPNYIEKNIQIPEFQRHLQDKLQKKIDDLKKKGLLDGDGSISEKGVELASLVMYTEELDNLYSKGMYGEKVHKKNYIYGDKEEPRIYKKGDRYSDVAMKKTLTKAIRRGHKDIKKEDMMTFRRQAKGNVNIIYGLDASSSMKGKKIEAAKKAGIALAFKAIQEKDKVGLVVFESMVKESLAPTDDFSLLVHKMSAVRATKQTDFKKLIQKAIELFPDKSDVTKHLVILTDAMPTVGQAPEKAALDATSEARAADITISIIGIGLEKKGEKLAKRIAEIGGGRFRIVKNLDMLDRIILEDYYEYY